MHEYEVHKVLQKQFGPPAYAYLPQVRNQTGYAKKHLRTADALALSLWPSRGLNIHGFEIKRSWTDLKKEIDDPEKAEEIAQYCGFWWLVVTNEKIMDNLVVPDKWGIIRCNDKCDIVKQAPKHEPKPFDKSMMFAILRRVAETMTIDAEINRRVDEKVKEIHDRTYNAGVEHGMNKSKIDREIYDRVRRFEEQTGIMLQYEYGLDRSIDKARKLWSLIMKSEETGFGFFEMFTRIKGEVRSLNNAVDKIVDVINSVEEGEEK